MTVPEPSVGSGLLKAGVTLGKSAFDVVTSDDKVGALQRYYRKAEGILLHPLIRTRLLKPHVVITGLPNTGKTCLHRALVTRNRLGLDQALPSFSTDLDVNTFVDNTGKCWALHALPGDTAGQVRRNAELALIFNRRLRGVIYVANFGYTNYRLPDMERSSVQLGVKSIEDNRNQRLAEELADFRAVCSTLTQAYSTTHRPKWLIVLVNKVDLIVDREGEAMDYYNPRGTGPFAAILRDTYGKAAGPTATEYATAFAYGHDFHWNNNRIQSLGTDQVWRVRMKSVVDLLTLLLAR